MSIWVDAERRQRIEYRADDRLRRRHRAGLAGAFHAERIGIGRHAGQRDVELRQVVGARQCIVHERAAEHLTGLRIVHRVLQHRLADALRDAALHLSDRQHRIDQRAEIIHRGVAFQRHRAGLGIDLHFGDVAAVGEGDQVEQVPDIGVETWRHAVGQIGRIACRTRDRQQIDGRDPVRRAPRNAHRRRRPVPADACSSRAAIARPFASIASTALHSAAPPMCIERAPP